MKRRLILVFAALVVIVGAGLVIGEEEKKDQPKRDKGKQVEGEKRTRPARGERRARSPRGVGADEGPGGAARRGRGPAAFDQQMEQRGKRHKGEMKQLKAIKKMAVKEKASKTAELIQKLIDKKQKAFDEVVKKSEERRERFKKMMEERGGAPGERGGRGRRPRPEGERGGGGRGRRGGGGENAEKDVEKEKD